MACMGQRPRLGWRRWLLFTFSPTSRGEPYSGCDLTWERASVSLGPQESPPMTLGRSCLCPAGQASVPVPCWKGRQVWLPQHLRPTRGQCWAGCPSSQATPTRAPKNCPALLALGNPLSSSSLPFGSAQSRAKSMQDTHTAQAEPLDSPPAPDVTRVLCTAEPQAPSCSTCSQTTSL